MQHPPFLTVFEKKRWTKGAVGDSTIPDHHRAETVSHPPEKRYTFTRGCSYSYTALVIAVPGYHTCLVRILLDGGSDTSYICASVADDMHLPVIGSDTFACIGFQEKAEKAQKYNQVHITLTGWNSGPPAEFHLWKTDLLCAPLPPRKPPSLTALEGIHLADDFGAGPIDMLNGTDQIYNVILWSQIPISRGPRAIETIFGYVIHGGAEAASLLPRCYTNYRQKVDPLWDLDSLGITDQEVKDCKSYPESKWNEEGKRYEMNLVWNSEDRPASNLRVVLTPRTSKSTTNT